MTILFDSLRRVHPRRPVHVFGQGVSTSDHRQPYSVADLAWAAANLNAIGQSDAHYDTLAEESLNQSRYEGGFVSC